MQAGRQGGGELQEEGGRNSFCKEGGWHAGEAGLQHPEPVEDGRHLDGVRGPTHGMGFCTPHIRTTI